MPKLRTFRATVSPRIFSQATRSPAPSLIERSVAWPTPTSGPNAVSIIVTGIASWSPAIASTPQPCPMNTRSTTA